MVVQIGTGTQDLNQLLMMLMELKKKRESDEGQKRMLDMKERSEKFTMSLNMAKARKLEPGTPEFDSFMKSRHPEMYEGSTPGATPKAGPSAFDDLMKQITFGDEGLLTAGPKAVAGAATEGLTNLISGGHYGEWKDREKSLNDSSSRSKKALGNIAKRAMDNESLKNPEDKMARVQTDVRDMSRGNIPKVNPEMYGQMVDTLGIGDAVAHDRQRSGMETALSMGGRPEVMQQQMEEGDYKNLMIELLRTLQ